MRAYILMALALLAVSSCDSENPAAKPATVSCNCATPPAPAPLVTPAPAPEPVVHHRGHGRSADRGFSGAHLWRASGYRWRREYAEAAVFTYDYHSDSHAYNQGEAAYDGESAGDWHGRHGRSVAVSDDDTKLRMKAWQGYDVDCPDDKR